MDRGSQYGEIDWIISNLELPAAGTFVEVGASDGLENSNTVQLEDAGWNGLLIEADPRIEFKLRANRRAAVVMCACGSTDGATTFHLNPVQSWSGVLSDGELIDVRTRRLDTLLPGYGIEHVDLLSIDTEGTELDVWDSLGAFPRPPIVIIEHTTNGTSNEAEILKRMKDYLLVHRTDCNLIFSK